MMLLHTIPALVLILQGIFCFGGNNVETEDVQSIPCSVCGNAYQPQLYKYSAMDNSVVSSEMAPWHASIYSKLPRGWSLLCGGTLITSRAVLTAAICLTLNNSNSLMDLQDIRVVLGKTNLWWNVTSQYEMRQQVREIHVHPNYKSSSSKVENDIALIVLDAKVSCTRFLAPVCLDYELKNSPQYQEYDFGMSTGYGFVKDMAQWSIGRNEGSSLMHTSVLILDYKKCLPFNETYSIRYEDLQSAGMFCILKILESPIQRVNVGDGITVDNEGLHYLVGVSSTRLTSSQSEPLLNLFGIVSNVTYHMKWIKENLPEDN